MTSDVSITPRRRLQATLPYVVALAAGLFLFYLADQFQFEQVPGRIGPGAWPKLILGLMLITSLWGLVSSFFSAGKVAEHFEHEEDEALAKPPEIYPYRVWIAVGGTLAYLLLLPVLGFFVATTIFVFGLMYLGEFRRPLSIALLSLSIALAFMFVFMRVVYVALPLGISPFDQVSYALMTAMGVH